MIAHRPPFSVDVKSPSNSVLDTIVDWLASLPIDRQEGVARVYVIGERCSVRQRDTKLSADILRLHRSLRVLYSLLDRHFGSCLAKPTCTGEPCC